MRSFLPSWAHHTSTTPILKMTTQPLPADPPRGNNNVRAPQRSCIARGAAALVTGRSSISRETATRSHANAPLRDRMTGRRRLDLWSRPRGGTGLPDDHAAAPRAPRRRPGTPGGLTSSTARRALRSQPRGAHGTPVKWTANPLCQPSWLGLDIFSSRHACSSGPAGA